MRINPVGVNAPVSGAGAAAPAEQAEKSFGATVKDALSEVNKLQSSADQTATKFASGDAVEIHQAMIAMQKASMALQFTIQVRNKILEAYQEVMRMQV